MAKTLEQLAQEIYDECLADGDDVTKEEAFEMAEMEIKAKGIKNYVQSSVEKKKRKPRERKVDEEKKYLLGCVETLYKDMGADIVKIKTETEIEFYYNDNHYTIKLTKHRPKKQDVYAFSLVGKAHDF